MRQERSRWVRTGSVCIEMMTRCFGAMRLAILPPPAMLGCASPEELSNMIMNHSANSPCASAFTTLEPLQPDVSHEMRTLLTVIQVALGLLNSGKLGTLSAPEQRMVEMAANNAERLLRLANAIEGDTETTAFLSATKLAQLRLERDLESALAHQELTLNYQPIVSLASRRLIGFEALLRWQHPALGWVSPAQFIPVAEATGLITDIGAWVLQEACCQLRRWQQQYPDECLRLTVSVNLSSKQLADPDLVTRIEQTLRESGLLAQNLVLEITESAVLENATTAKQTLEQLQQLGVEIHIDDFGTGYSSLSRLYELPLNALKIDRSFVQKLDSQNGEYLIRAIIGLAHNLGIDVVAEGIETVEQALKLYALGCTKAQGFFFAKPADITVVSNLIGQVLPAIAGKQASIFEHSSKQHQPER